LSHPSFCVLDTESIGPRSKRCNGEEQRGRRQAEVLDLWFRELTPNDWFADGHKRDPVVRTRFGDLDDDACVGTLDDWQESPLCCLALILVLDRFSRHIYRDTSRAFAQD
jgi:uncharacterized protein (DUF924 family)